MAFVQLTVLLTTEKGDILRGGQAECIPGMDTCRPDVKVVSCRYRRVPLPRKRCSHLGLQGLMQGIIGIPCHIILTGRSDTVDINITSCGNDTLTGMAGVNQLRGRQVSITTGMEYQRGVIIDNGNLARLSSVVR